MSRARRLSWVLTCQLLVVGCGGASSPTAPSGVAAPQAPPPQTLAPSVSLGAVGQMVAGRFTYFLRVGVASGAKDIVITRIDFRYPESTQAEPFSGLGFITMNHTVRAGGSYGLDKEFMSMVAVSELAVTVSYTDSAGQQGQLVTSKAMPAIVQGEPSLTLRLDAFTVSGFVEGTGYGYWPKLTLTTSAGTGVVTVTRLQFFLAGAGSPPPYRGSWRIPAQSTVQLFHNEFYGEPELYLTSDSRVEEVSVLVSYVDVSGRSADVRAVATVAR